jgi:hypothetical protein
MPNGMEEYRVAFGGRRPDFRVASAILREMAIRSAGAGDVYLLFHQLPFKFDKDLPLSLGTGICLDSTPAHTPR